MTNVKRADIEEITRSPVSLMPEGLLNTLKEDEVLDLMAYLLSRGDRQNAMFKRSEVRFRGSMLSAEARSRINQASLALHRSQNCTMASKPSRSW